MKRVILVGATDGLGKALAEVYAARGFWVTILGRSPGKLEALVAELRRHFPVATVNGVVTVKPTVGLISRAGIIPIAHSQDTAGPLTRTVRDAAILLRHMASADHGGLPRANSRVL